MSNNFKIFNYKIKLWWIYVCAVILVLFVFLWLLFGPVKIFNADPKTYVVESGSTITEVATDLKQEKIIRSERAFLFACDIMEVSLYAGAYSLSPGMPVFEVAGILSEPISNIDSSQATLIYEGIRLPEVAAELEAGTGIPASDFLALWSDPVFLQEVIDKYEFVTDEILNPEIKQPLEGYLFPATYYFPEDATAKSITFEMLDQMEINISQYEDKIKKSGYTYHEILTLASIIQMEVNNFDDMKDVSSVFQNRLEAGMPLQSCATVNYALGKSDFHLTLEQIETVDPYNTYNESSLPPGPISNVTLNAIDAAVIPSNTDYLYFLADVNGNTYFASTYEEHLKNKELYIDAFD